MEQSETAEKLVKLLKKKNLTVTTAESCTGGMIASAIVSVAGASACFKEGYITYSNEAKKKLLGVREDTLKQYTVVSAQVAQEMAAGAAAAAQSSLAVSVTGVAGPDPDEGNPVGLVYIGCYLNGKTTVKMRHVFNLRAAVKKSEDRQPARHWHWHLGSFQNKCTGICNIVSK